MKHPPGNEIYRDEKISIFEVDGRKNKVTTNVQYVFYTIYMYKLIR
jgi:hypothetical protein